MLADLLSRLLSHSYIGYLGYILHLYTDVININHKSDCCDDQGELIKAGPPTSQTVIATATKTITTTTTTTHMHMHASFPTPQYLHKPMLAKGWASNAGQHIRADQRCLCCMQAIARDHDSIRIDHKAVIFQTLFGKMKHSIDDDHLHNDQNYV